MSVPVRDLPVAAPRSGLLTDEDVLPALVTWHREGLRTALVTLVGIEGAAPRALGAQMAVAEDGRSFGYLSGGCLEQAIVLEAQDVIRSGKNRLVRYGRGSRYIDIKLPCGSGLDIYFDCTLGSEPLSTMAVYAAARKSFVLRTPLTGGESQVVALARNDKRRVSAREGDVFSRVFVPSVRILLLGSGPALSALALLAKAAGLEIEIWSSDAATLANISEAGLEACAQPRLSDSAIDRLDSSSAVVLVFHEHDVEPDIIARLLQRDCFYIGVLGNRGVHRQRVEALAALGIDGAELSRLRAPVGSIQGAKSKATLAVGILAELMAEAKARNLVA